MEPLGLTAYRVAQDTGMPESRIGTILRGRRAVTAETAIHLASYFGISPEFWLNLQSRPDLAIAEDGPRPPGSIGARLDCVSMIRLARLCSARCIRTSEESAA